MKVRLLHPMAKAPVQGSDHAVGFDVCALDGGLIGPGERLLVGTGIAAQAPEGCYIRVAPRSGLASKHGIHATSFKYDDGDNETMAGVIDRDYTGEIGVLLINLGPYPFEFKAGDKIAQFIQERCSYESVEIVGHFDDTVRGDGAYGSTGK